jgi:hypothetical protein
VEIDSPFGAAQQWMTWNHFTAEMERRRCCYAVLSHLGAEAQGIDLGAINPRVDPI